MESAKSKKLIDIIFLLLLFSFTLTVYILTLSRSVYYGDSGEFIAVAKTLGVAHPPGYPLYTMLAHLFTYLPFGNIAFKVNLFSAVTSSLTVVVIYLACLKLTGNRLASASASLILAFSYLFWLYSLVAEVFSLNNLFVALIVLISLHIFEKPQNKKLFYLLSFVFALALTNHHTIVLLAPALLFLIFATNPKLLLQPKFLILNSLFIILGLLPYLYLPIRASADPILNWGDPDTVERFLHHILRKDYGTFTLSKLGRGEFFNLKLLLIYLDSLKDYFSWAAAVLMVVGTVLLWRLKRTFIFLLVVFFTTGPVFILISRSQTNPVQIGVIERFFLASSISLILFLSVSIYAIYRLNIRHTFKLNKFVILLFLLPLILNFNKVNQRNNFLYEDYGRKLFSLLPKDSNIFVSHDDVFMISLYLQGVENQRPDLKVINFTTLPSDWHKKNLQQKYPNFSLPWQEITTGLKLSEGGKIICDKVVPYQLSFTDKWYINSFPQNDNGCSYLPHFLAVKLSTPENKFKLEKLEEQLLFWEEINTRHVKNLPNDRRTQALIYNYSDLQTFLGATLAENGEGQKALQVLENSYNLYPNALTAYLIAEEYYRLANYNEVIRWDENVLKNSPDFPQSHKRLGKLYLENFQDKKKAYFHLQKYLNLTPGTADRQQIEETVNKLKNEI